MKNLERGADDGFREKAIDWPYSFVFNMRRIRSLFRMQRERAKMGILQIDYKKQQRR